MQNGDTLTLDERRYRLDERIAPGAYGEVWAATDPDGHPVAIKFVNTEQMARVDPAFGPRWRAHLEREIAFLRQLSADETAHIVTLLDYEETDGQPVLVLERMDANLDQWLKQAPQPLPPRQILDWARQILAGLTTVHAHQFVYRDLKFSNVLVGDDGRRLKLADFGTLKPQRNGGTVSFAGTPAAMAPEQRLPARCPDGRPIYDIDHRTDYYALGLILFALFTGQRTLASQYEIEQVLERVGHEGARREGQTLGGLNDAEKDRLNRKLWARMVGDATFGAGQNNGAARAHALYALIVALLAPRKEDRPTSAEDIGTVLDDALAALPEDSKFPMNGGCSPAEPPPPNPLLPHGEEVSNDLLFSKTPSPAREGWGGTAKRPSSPGSTRRRWLYPLLIGITGFAAAFGLRSWLMRPEAPPPVDTSPSLVELVAPKQTEPVANTEPAKPLEPAPVPAAPAQASTEPAVAFAPPPVADPAPSAVPVTAAPPARVAPVAKPAPAPKPPAVANRPPSPAKPAPTVATDRPSPPDTPAFPVTPPTPEATPSRVANRPSSPVKPAPTVLRDPLDVGGFAPELVIVPAGTLVLPGADGQAERTVTIQPFALTPQPITFAAYELFARRTERSLPYDGGLDREQRAARPVTSITWYEAQAYVEWLSERTGQRYRLPSEAEWVHAGQAGVSKRGQIDREWVADCAGGDCDRHILRGNSGSGSQPADRGGRDIGFRVARELNPVDTPP